MYLRQQMKRTSLASLAVVITMLGGCKPNPENVKLAVETSIYQNRPFFAQLCGFEIDPMSNPGIRADVSEIDAQKRPSGDAGAPATAKLHLTKVKKKAEPKPGSTTGGLFGSDSPEVTCDAKIGFMWGEKSKATTDRVHKAGEQSTWFEAWDFKKL